MTAAHRAPSADPVARSEGAMLVLDITSEVAGQLAVAIERHRRNMAASGLSVPPNLVILGQALASRALRGPQGPSLEDVARMTEPAPVTRQLLNIDETAAALACSTRTVKRLIAAGRLPAVKVAAGATRIRVTDLTTYVANLSAIGSAECQP